MNFTYLAKDFVSLTVLTLEPYPDGIDPTVTQVFLSKDVKIVAPFPFSFDQMCLLPSNPPTSISDISHSSFNSNIIQPGEVAHIPF